MKHPTTEALSSSLSLGVTIMISKPLRRMPQAKGNIRLLFITSLSFLTAASIFSPTVLAASSPSSSPSIDDVQVIVYSGPNECNNNANTHGTLNKVIPNSIVGLHFSVTIESSSIGSRSLLGKVIESSKSGLGVAPSFPVGQGKVIRGLDVGLIGLCRGSSAYIIVPPYLGYGHVGKPNVGVEPDTTLRYDVEILDIQPPIPNDFIKIDINQDWLISLDEATMYFDTLGQAIDLEGLWKDEDADQDGYISWMEFTGPKGADGPPKTTADATELKRREQTNQREGGRGLDDIATLLQNIDTDNDGKISKLELTETFRSLGEEMTEDFWRDSDPDGDGYVSYEEFVGGRRSTTSGTTASTSDKMVKRGDEL